MQGEGERGCGGLVPGEQEDQHLLAEFGPVQAAVRCELPVAPQAEEVAWHAFLPEEEPARVLPVWEWVPDGLEAYRRLREPGSRA
jgi:hypothetical protein